MVKEPLTPYQQTSTSEVLETLDGSGSSGIISDNLPPPHRLSRLVVASAIALVLILGGGSLLVAVLTSSKNNATNYEATPRPSVLPAQSSSDLTLQDVLVNGQLHVNNGLVITPTVQPGKPTLGQVYLSSSTGQLSYYNGSQFVALGSGSSSSGQGSSVGLQGPAGPTGLQGRAGANGATPTSASTLTSGTLSDARLSSNVALLDRDSQVFQGLNEVFQNSSDSTNAFEVQAADGTPELTVDTLNNNITTTNLLPEVASNGVINSGFTLTAAVTPEDGSSDNNESLKWLAIGADGFGRYVYIDNYGTTLQLVRCLNATCGTSNNTTIATDVNGLDNPSITMGPDGLPRVTYLTDDTTNQLHYIQCLNADCTSDDDTVVASGSQLVNNAFTLDSNGLARIIYTDASNSPFVVDYIECLNASCSSATAPVTFSSSNLLIAQDIQMAPNGLPALIYMNYNNGTDTGDMYYVTCLSQNCGSSTSLKVTNSSTGDYAFYGTLLFDGNNLPGISYTDFASNINNNYISCNDISCSSLTDTTVVSSSEAPIASAVGSNGYPIMAAVGSDGEIFISCSNETCSNNIQTAVDADGNSPDSITLGNDGFARIVDYNNTHSQYDYIQLTTTNGKASVNGTSIGSSSAAYGAIYGTVLNGQQLQLNGSATNTLTVQNPQGNSVLNVDTSNDIVSVDGSINGTASLLPPEDVSVGSVGTTGATTYGYEVTAENASGETLPSLEATTTNGDSTLSSSNYNSIQWDSVPGAQSYCIYRTTDGSGSLGTGGIGCVPSGTNVFDDTGLTGTGSPPTQSTAGRVVNLQGSLGSVTVDSQGNLTVSPNTTATIPSLNVTRIGDDTTGPSYGLTGYWFNNSGGYDNSPPVWDDVDHTSDGASAVATTIDGPLDYTSMLADHPTALGPLQLDGSQSQELQGISVHWEGWVKADYTGVYTFYSQADDEVSVSVNNQQIINNWNCCDLPEASGTISLVAGQWYPISVDYGNHSYDGTVYLKWSEANITKQLVPEDHLVNSNPADGLPNTADNSIQVVDDAAFTNKLEDVTSSGSYLQFNPSYNQNGAVQVATRSASNVGLVIQGSDVQGADLLDIQNSSGSVLTSFSNTGRLDFTTATGDAGTIINISGVANGNDVNGGLINITNTGNAPALTTTDNIFVNGVVSSAGGSFLSSNGGGIGTDPAVSGVNEGNSGTGVLASSNAGDAFEAWYDFGTGSQALLTQITSSGTLSVFPLTANSIGEVIKGASNQTADLLQAQDSNGDILDKIDSSGNLTVVAAIINGTLTVNGNIVTGGGTPTYIAQSNQAGGAACDNAPTITIGGTDTDGLLTITTPNSGTCGAGALVSVVFATDYSNNAPNVTLTPANGDASAIQYFVDQSNTNGSAFLVSSNSAVSTSTVYKYYYHVLD